MTAKDILDEIGRDVCRDVFGVQDRILQTHAANGVLPALWFDACERLLDRPLPRDLFTFKPVANK